MIKALFRSILLTVRDVFLTESVIATVIVLNSLLLFVMGFQDLRDENLLDFIDHAFTLFFVFEVVFKVNDKGWNGYFSVLGNKFDFFLVVISLPSLVTIFVSLPDMSYLLAFRLLRVIRILRFMRFIPNLSNMLAGIRRAFKASVFVILALFIYNVLLAILSSYIYQDLAPEFFGNPFLSLYSIFRIFTVEGWHEIPEAIAANPAAPAFMVSFSRFYFLLIVLSGGILGFSMVNAIFVDEMTMDNNKDLERKIDDLNKKMNELLKKK